MADGEGSGSPGLDVYEDWDAWRSGLLEAVTDEMGGLRQQVSDFQRGINDNLGRLTERMARQNTEIFAQITADVQEYMDAIAQRVHKLETQVQSIEASLAGRLTELQVPVQSTTAEAPVLEMGYTEAEEQEMPSLEDQEEICASSAQEGQPVPVQVEEESTITSLSELDGDIAKAVEEHLPIYYTANEKLTPLQCGFFYWQCQELQITDCRDLTRKSQAILEAGLFHRIWVKSWIPPGSQSMVAYLGEKIKTMLKKKRRASEVKETIRTVLDKRKREDDGGESSQ